MTNIDCMDQLHEIQADSGKLQQAAHSIVPPGLRGRSAMRKDRLRKCSHPHLQRLEERTAIMIQNVVRMRLKFCDGDGKQNYVMAHACIIL